MSRKSESNNAENTSNNITTIHVNIKSFVSNIRNIANNCKLRVESQTKTMIMKTEGKKEGKKNASCLHIY